MYSQATHVLVQGTIIHDIGKFLQKASFECYDMFNNLQNMHHENSSNPEDRLHISTKIELETTQLNNHVKSFDMTQVILSTYPYTLTRFHKHVYVARERLP